MLKLVILLTIFVISEAENKYLITAPNVFRVNVEEDVFVSIFGTGQTTISVTVRLTNSLDELVATRSVDVTEGAPGIVKFLVDPSKFPDDEEIPVMNVEVTSNDAAFQFKDKAMALVTTKNQVVFLQTDKPIYTPNQDVKIKVISLNEEMKPTDRKVRLDIVTPTGAIIQREDNLVTQSGYITRIFQFSSYPTYGIWSIIASYGQDNEWKSTIEFELREYVLPTFEVKIEGQKEILSTDNALTATVTARYVYKKDVRGTAQLKMKVIRDGEIIGEFPTEGKILNGLGQAGFVIDPAVKYGNGWFQKFLKGTLHVEAVVTEKSTGDRENTSISGAKFVESVYSFKRDRTISHFKKGTTFDIKVDLIHSDGSPGIGVLCEVDAYGIDSNEKRTKLTGHKEFLLERTSNALGQVDFRVDVNQDTERIAVEIKTLDDNYPEAVQKPYTFTLHPIESINGAYLQLRVRPGEIEIADNYEVEVVKSGTAEVHGLNFVVVSKGRIVQTSSEVGNALGSQKTIRIDITKDMVPSARLIIFSFVDDEVVADSILLDIVEECKSQLIVRVDDKTLGPSQDAHFTIIGAAGSVVNLLAVDEAVYFLKDFHRLTKKKMFQRMETLDLGCGPGGGADSMEIFENAGMLAMSNAKLNSNSKKTDVRSGYGCPTMTERRRKRAANENGQRTCYEDFRDNKALCSACEDGLLVIPGKNCEQRIKRFAKRKRLTIPDDIGSPPDVTRLDPIIAVFYNCCIAKQEELNIIAGRVGGDDVHIEEDENLVRVRSNFPETWISFFEDTIPDNRQLQLSFTVPDSITNWIVQTSSISASMGMCVADEEEIEVSKDVFLALKMPYSIVRGEQTQVQATLFNYRSDPLDANVYMYGTENVCSKSLPGERGERVRFHVPANDAQSTFFNILPLDVGTFSIEVKAFTSAENDGIRKTITVVHEGVERYYAKTILFDPTGERVVASEPGENVEEDKPLEGEFQIKPSCPRDTENSVQTCTFELGVADFNAIPGTEQCYITFFGDLMSPAVSALINGFDPFSLFQAPAGCGEQTMMRMSANVYTMVYLSNTADRLEAEVEEKGYQLMDDSYRRMITYQVALGGFAVWASHPPSTWLSAYTVRVFYQVLKLDGFVDQDVFCQAYTFLAARYEDVVAGQGKFYEGYNARHKDMTGGVNGDTMMTAFVVITLLGSNPANLQAPFECMNYDVEIERAVNYLEAQIDTLETPYARAIVSYALNIAGSDEADDLWTILKEEASFDEEAGTRHWEMNTATLTIEATSYALLTAVQRNEIAYANGIVNWLTVHGDYKRGWSTTSSTGIALEALATYAMETATTPVNMNCKVSSTAGGNSVETTIKIDEENKDLSQIIQCVTRGLTVIKCDGQGVAQAQVEVIYNSPASSSEAECDFFIDVKMTKNEDNPPDKEIHTVVIRTKYRVLNGETNMVIVQAGLISGFEPVEDTLKALVNNLETPVDRYEISDRKVVLYLTSLTSEITTLPFEVVKAFEIVNPQSAQVAVYDYYSPERKCGLFYNPFDDQTELRKFCTDDLCQCAAGACPHCIKINNGNLEHTGNDVIPTGNELYNDYACGLEEDKAMDYVFEVVVQGHVERDGFVDLTGSVSTVMKMGADSFEDRPDPQTAVVRNFVMKTSCTLCKEWKVGQKYLIMGRDGIRYKPEGSNTYLYKYLLDKTSYIEEWAKKSVHKDRARELKVLKNSLLNSGCPL